MISEAEYALGKILSVADALSRVLEQWVEDKRIIMTWLHTYTQS